MHKLHKFIDKTLLAGTGTLFLLHRGGRIGTDKGDVPEVVQLLGNSSDI